MVERTEVAREARRVAAAGRSPTPRPTARRLRHEAEDYVDQKLAAFEVVLERTMATVQQGPRAAPGRGRAAARDLADEHTGLEAMYDSDEDRAVFDQDDR